jgi:hypothetical protein
LFRRWPLDIAAPQALRPAFVFDAHAAFMPALIDFRFLRVMSLSPLVNVLQ